MSNENQKQQIIKGYDGEYKKMKGRQKKRNGEKRRRKQHKKLVRKQSKNRVQTIYKIAQKIK